MPMKLPWEEHLKGEPMFKVINKTKISCFNYWKKILNLLKFFDNETVYFEGGLGSQIIAYIVYNEKNKIQKNICATNLDYFSNTPYDFTQVNGLYRRAWKLDHYGISNSKLVVDKKIKKVFKKYFLVRPEFYTEIFLNFREEKVSEYNSIFPVDTKVVNKFLQKIFQNSTLDYSIIHIRRGDYLKLASNIIKTEEVVNLINKLKPILTTNVLITCDSILPKEDVEILEKSLSGHNYVYLDPNEDIYLVHDLMRSAKILIASNSTFSFTAGLLSNKDCLFFFPTKYFGNGRSEDLKAFPLRQPFGFLIS